MMSVIDPMAARCPACLAEPGERCYATSSDEPRAIPHRLRGLAAAKSLRRCTACQGVGWEPDGELEVAEPERTAVRRVGE